MEDMDKLKQEAAAQLLLQEAYAKGKVAGIKEGFTTGVEWSVSRLELYNKTKEEVKA